MRRDCPIDANRFLYPDAANLPAMLYLYRERYPTAYRRIVAAVKAVAPFFEDFVLEPLRLNPRNIALHWRAKESDYEFGPHQLSDGTLRAIALFTLLLQPEEDLPELIVLDEPELGLHPAALAVLADLLKSAARHSQLLVATQSTALIDHFEVEDIVTVNLRDGCSTFERLDPEAAEGLAGRVHAQRTVGAKRDRRGAVLMVRLYFYVEGQTEQEYATRVLTPHLAGFGVQVMGAVLAASGRKHGQVSRGGGRRYQPMRKDLGNLLRQHKTADVRFTTMFDLYALHDGFPGWDEAEKQRHIPRERVLTLEKAFAADVGDHRFIPHIQLYEFETILLCEPGHFALVYEESRRWDRRPSSRGRRRDLAGTGQRRRGDGSIEANHRSVSRSTAARRPPSGSSWRTVSGSTRRDAFALISTVG